MKKKTTNFLGYMALATCLHQIVSMGNVYAAGQDYFEPVSVGRNPTIRDRLTACGLNPDTDYHVYEALIVKARMNPHAVKAQLAETGDITHAAFVLKSFLNQGMAPAEAFTQLISARSQEEKTALVTACTHHLSEALSEKIRAGSDISSLAATLSKASDLPFVSDEAKIHIKAELASSTLYDSFKKEQVPLPAALVPAEDAPADQERALQLATLLETYAEHHRAAQTALNPDQDTLEILEHEIGTLEAVHTTKTAAFEEKAVKLDALNARDTELGQSIEGLLQEWNSYIHFKAEHNIAPEENAELTYENLLSALQLQEIFDNLNLADRERSLFILERMIQQNPEENLNSAILAAHLDIPNQIANFISIAAERADQLHPQILQVSQQLNALHVAIAAAEEEVALLEAARTQAGHNLAAARQRHAATVTEIQHLRAQLREMTPGEYEQIASETPDLAKLRKLLEKPAPVNLEKLHAFVEQVRTAHESALQATNVALQTAWQAAQTFLDAHLAPAAVADEAAEITAVRAALRVGLDEGPVAREILKNLIQQALTMAQAVVAEQLADQQAADLAAQQLADQQAADLAAQQLADQQAAD
ncbi:MAG: hypothetical protein WCG05_05565, partial [Alphaproteobacteria bacterium]